MRVTSFARRLLRLGVLMATSALIGISTLVGASPAAADATYNPGAWNGYTIYLSQACHDGNDGTPGGPCLTNYGCGTYDENSQSFTTAVDAAIGANSQLNLVERGYRTIRGDGTVNQNIAASNAAGARMHIPLHTNAKSDNCVSSSPAGNGTQVLYLSTNGSRCADIMVGTLAASSPGTSDTKVRRTNLGELNNTNGVACYLEAEFHTWNRGVDWIRTEQTWSWRIGYTVDQYFGYP